MNIYPGDKTAIFWGADRDLKDWPLRDQIKTLLKREKYCNSFSMTDQGIADFIKKQNKIKPKYIYGYASSLYLVAKSIEKNNITINFQPTAISSSAETLHDFQRELIEKIFGCKIFNFYGSRETNNIAVECEAHNGLHINASSRIIEILDNNGKPVNDGELGNIAITDLSNHAFPFIRYLNGDVAKLSTKSCSCGRTLPVLEKLYGRSSDFIYSGTEMIHGELFTHLMYNRPSIQTFQLTQHDILNYSLLLVPTKTNIDNNIISEINHRIKEKIGKSINLKIDMVDSIPKTKTGKHRFTISEISQ
jgi:phenylacetate-CoA ligase